MEEEIRVSKAADKRSARRMALVIVAGLVAAALVLGGVSGSAATIFWMSARQAPTMTPVTVANAVFPVQLSTAPAVTDITAIYRSVSPAVVGITAVVSPSRSRGTFPQQGQATGTGFIVDDQGYILTNYHVVEGATKVSITLLDGTKLDSRVAGTDPGSDLAVLKTDIPGGKPVVAPLGDSDKVQPGELAIALGNPFGLDHTLTSGIVSAVNREYGSAGSRPMRGLIQTDAPINPGNSGGPLFNANGEVIGITTSIESPVQGSVGIGFAIPINKAKSLLPQLQSGQKVDHTYLGISGTAINADFASAYKLPVDSGIYVAQVTADGPSASAGLRGASLDSVDASATGDIITAVDGKAVKTVPELSAYIDTKKVGDTVTLTVIRDGNTIKVDVVLGAWPAPQQG